METAVRTPQDVFLQPQRLVVPLFQRPYVWSEELQWEPLWSDVQQQTLKVLRDGGQNVLPHFLGAVVLQQSPSPIGGLQEWTVIDGQQRLTTLQLLFDAASDVLEEMGVTSGAQRLRDTVENGTAYRRHEEDRYKVWPTNHDRPAFAEVMSAATPVDYGSLQHRRSRLVEAHRYFSTSIREFVNADPDGRSRAEALADSLLTAMKFAVIQLGPDENAQEIFETLNARGTPLTPADLIKNLVFQRISAGGEDPEAAYREQWSAFDDPFWEEVVSKGRRQHTRLSMYFNYWLISELGDQVLDSEVFRSFKRYLDTTTRSPSALLADIRAQADRYRAVTEPAETAGNLDHLGRFVYRIQALDQGVVTPVLLWLVDPLAEPVPHEQLRKALVSLESWVMRRVLTRKNTKRYNLVLLDLLKRLQDAPRSTAGDGVESYLAGLRSETDYWPGDDEVRGLLETIAAYHSFPRARLRVLLEALEDDLRGIGGTGAKQAEQQVPRTYTIEHIMPQEWRRGWPLGRVAAEERDVLIQTLGNLTLLPQRFNTSVSNAPWAGEQGKRKALLHHSDLKLNARITEHAQWDEDTIRARTRSMVDAVLRMWPVPEGHEGLATGVRALGMRANMGDLLSAGLLSVGQELTVHGDNMIGVARVNSDGRLLIHGRLYRTAGMAARAFGQRGGREAWFVDAESGVTLADLFTELAARTGAEVTAEETSEDEE